MECFVLKKIRADQCSEISVVQRSNKQGHVDNAVETI